MPHNNIIRHYIKRTCIKKGSDYENFITLGLLFKRYTAMINRLNTESRELESNNRILTLEVSTLKAELESSDRIIMQLKEQNENLKKNLTL